MLRQLRDVNIHGTVRRSLYRRTMSSLAYHTRHIVNRGTRCIIFAPSRSRRMALADSRIPQRRCFHPGETRLSAQQATRGESPQQLQVPKFWADYKETFNAPLPTLPVRHITPDHIGTEVTIAGFLTKTANLSEALVFGTVSSGVGVGSMQIICRDQQLCTKLKSIGLHSPVVVVGILAPKHAPKSASQDEKSHKKDDEEYINHKEVEVVVTRIVCLNDVPADLHLSYDHNYSAKDRHLQLRFDHSLKDRILFRSHVAAYIRRVLSVDFTEIETPLLFKSTAEGAREFLVPTRKAGHAYALPQSPQQYKQILMATGIRKYFQFAKCFRDEDLRADRQPEFTQVDMEMAFADGSLVMQKVEGLMKGVYNNFSNYTASVFSKLDDEAFLRMSYDEAMSEHGSDKPDLRINALIHRVDHIVPDDFRGMLTSVKDPIIEAFKIRLDGSPRRVQKFIRDFMDSPDAEAFKSNVDGAPGICMYNSSRPVEGLQTLGFEGAEKLKSLYEQRERRSHESAAAYSSGRSFEDGDLILIQARENLPHSGGSTVLGKLRLAIYKAALTEELIEPDTSHRYLWITDFPMFTLDNDTDPGQGGSAGFSATHHPFTAPKTAADVDLLLTDPLKAKADHYDLVVNGVELGGGSRRIHNAEMQKFVMRDILKMGEASINEFSHLFAALQSGCPPHAGFAIGFDRLIAIMTGRESVRDVIAFPKSSKGEDMMVRSPSKITDAELIQYHLQFAKAVPEQEIVSVEPETAEEIQAEPPSQA